MPNLAKRFAKGPEHTWVIYAVEADKASSAGGTIALLRNALVCAWLETSEGDGEAPEAPPQAAGYPPVGMLRRRRRVPPWLQQPAAAPSHPASPGLCLGVTVAPSRSAASTAHSMLGKPQLYRYLCGPDRHSQSRW